MTKLIFTLCLLITISFISGCGGGGSETSAVEKIDSGLCLKLTSNRILVSGANALTAVKSEWWKSNNGVFYKQLYSDDKCTVGSELGSLKQGTITGEDSFFSTDMVYTISDPAHPFFGCTVHQVDDGNISDDQLFLVEEDTSEDCPDRNEIEEEGYEIIERSVDR